MHDMQTIVTNDWCLSVCPSVCLSCGSKSASLCKNDRTDLDPVWSEQFWGPKNIVLDVDPDTHSKGKGVVENLAH